MLQSLTSPFSRPRAERPSGAYKQGPSNRPAPTSAMRRRKTPVQLAAMSPKEEREALREGLQLAMNERRYSDALNHILGLIALDPSDPRWPHKYGDVLRSLRRNNEAAAAYRRAARRYESAGFPVRATAMMRLAGELEGDSGPRASEPSKSGTHVISGRNDATIPITDEQLKPYTKVG